MAASMTSARDVPLLVRSEHASAERRVSPAWTLAQLKTKLEPVTGIPPSCQRLTLRRAGQAADDEGVKLEAADEEKTLVSHWAVQAYAELQVDDTRPPSARLHLGDPSSVPKYVMPAAAYASLPDSVLAWKRSHHLGRFDPHAPAAAEARLASLWAAVHARRIAVGARCRVGGAGTAARRGRVAFVGEVPQIPGVGPWVGVALDEPVGRNDGAVAGTRYFECAERCGVFVRPERVEVGDFEPLGMEEEEEEDTEMGNEKKEKTEKEEDVDNALEEM